MLKQVRRAVFAAFFFSGCVNVLMLATPLYTLQVFETVVPTGSIETLVLLSLMAAAAMLALMLIELVRDTILLRTGLWLDHMLGQHILENGLKIGRAPAEMRADSRALAQVRQFLSSPALGALLDAPWTPFFMVALWLIHPTLGIMAACAGGLLVIAALAQSLLTARLQVESAQARETADQWWQTVTHNSQLTGALGLARGAADQWETFNRAHVAGSYSQGKRASVIKALARAVRIASQLAIYGLGAWLVVRSELAPGALVASAIMLGKALAPLESAVSSLRMAQAAFVSYRRLKSLPADATVPRLMDGEAAALGRLVLSDVAHYHPTRKTPALRSVSLTIEPGECIGIVGPNGSGKSTLCGILAGATQPTAGVADLDGVAVAKWQRADDPPPIGYLTDDPVLVEGTVYDNICRFREATLIGVAQSAMRAGVHETLSALQSGYDTQVGPGGSGLSLRERRAVALARAVHGAPRIIVLDEPELGLDGASLRQLMKMLEGLREQGIGLVVATQDPRLLRLTDKVVVLNAGAVQSVGPSADLARRMQVVGQPSGGDQSGQQGQPSPSRAAGDATSQKRG